MNPERPCAARLPCTWPSRVLAPQAPQLFDTLGSGETWGLIVHCIIGAVNVVTTFVAVFTVDRWGEWL